MVRTLAALALGLTLALPAAAGTAGGVTMADTATAGSSSLVLNGMAVRTKLFIKVYVGGLYLPAMEKDAAKILAADAPRRMDMHWLYGVDKAKVCEGWAEGLSLNTPNASATLKSAFDTLCGYMSDTSSGDKLIFTYVPGTGTTVEVKGEMKGTIPGKDFADALLACWIGPKPGPGADFKKALLGG